MKVETHNHPTAISPFPGASTGAGGEIRDEGRYRARLRAQGRPHGLSPCPSLGRPTRPARRQARPHRQPAADHDRGAAGRRRVQQRSLAGPNLAGYFREYEQTGGRCGARLPQAHHDRGRPGQHRRPAHAQDRVPAGTLLVQLGGPGMRIGMGGSAASSMGARTRPSWTLTGAARQPRDRTPRRRSSTTAGRRGGQPHPRHPRRGRGRPVQRLP